MSGISREDLMNIIGSTGVHPLRLKELFDDFIKDMEYMDNEHKRVGVARDFTINPFTIAFGWAMGRHCTIEEMGAVMGVLEAQLRAEGSEHERPSTH